MILTLLFFFKKELQSITCVTPAGKDVIDPDDALNIILKTKNISTEKYPK